MTGLDKMLSQLQAESDAACAAIQAEANEKAAAIVAAAAAEAEKESAAARVRADKAKADGLKRADSAAELVEKKALLQEKQTLIAETIQAAQEHLLQLDTEAYAALLLHMVSEGALAQDGVMILSDKDKKRLPGDFQQKLAAAAAEKGGKLTVAEETRPLNGGFVLSYGGIEENYSFKALFEANQEAYQDLVQRTLFGSAQ